MCRTTTLVHQKCRHIKSKTVTYRCQAALNNPDRLCPSLQGRDGHEVKWVEQPPLCVQCYRRQVDKITDAHDRHIRDLQKQIDQIKALRNKEDEVHQRVVIAMGTDKRRIQDEEIRHTKEYAPLLAKRWSLEDELTMAKAMKKEELADFRETMRDSPMTR